jgi:hypothetical protein
MVAKEHTGPVPGKGRRDSKRPACGVGTAVTAAINKGFVVGREVLVGSIPGIVVGYNIASFGQFIGNAYPLVVRTTLGVTKCSMDEVSLV